MNELLVERDGAVVRLTLNRPERRNALTPKLIEALLAELDRIDADAGVRVVVLTGAPPAFCAGYDIALLESPGGDGAGAERDLVERLSTRITRVRVPVIAKVNGVASGAGCDVAVSCDLRFASTEARLAMPPARLGILYSWEGTARLVATVGEPAAKELLFSGELIDAERALQIGMVNRVYSPDRLDEETERFVARIVDNAPLSVAGSKLIVDRVAAGAPLGPETLAEIEEAARGVWTSEDSKEGPQAFRERRAPEFKGR